MGEVKESDNNNINNIDRNVFSGNYRFLNIDVCKDIGLQTILHPTTVTGISFALINVKGVDVKEMRCIVFKESLFDFIGITETKYTDHLPTKCLKMIGMNHSKLI